MSVLRSSWFSRRMKAESFRAVLVAPTVKQSTCNTVKIQSDSKTKPYLSLKREPGVRVSVACPPQVRWKELRLYVVQQLGHVGHVQDVEVQQVVGVHQLPKLSAT